MKGPFIVKFLDYFNLEHSYLVWAQTSEEAIVKVKELYEYPIKEVVESYLDLHDWFHGKYSVSDIGEITN